MRKYKTVNITIIIITKHDFWKTHTLTIQITKTKHNLPRPTRLH